MSSHRKRQAREEKTDEELMEERKELDKDSGEKILFDVNPHSNMLDSSVKIWHYNEEPRSKQASSLPKLLSINSPKGSFEQSNNIAEAVYPNDHENFTLLKGRIDHNGISNCGSEDFRIMNGSAMTSDRCRIPSKLA